MMLIDFVPFRGRFYDVLGKVQLRDWGLKGGVEL